MAKAMDMIGFCGLHCGTCPAYTQSIANPAGELRRELIRNKCDKSASRMARIPGFGPFAHYRRFDDLLALLAKMRCRKPCRLGGGSPGCRIRKCAQGRNLAGCWQCDGFSGCARLHTLEEYGDIDRTYLKNLRRIKRQGVAGFLRAQSKKVAPKK
jgi:hypothetical protein